VTIHQEKAQKEKMLSIILPEKLRNNNIDRLVCRVVQEEHLEAVGIDLLCSSAIARGKRLLAFLWRVSALFEDIGDRHIKVSSLSGLPQGFAFTV
jgi:hypothetical protein